MTEISETSKHEPESRTRLISDINHGEMVEDVVDHRQFGSHASRQQQHPSLNALHDHHRAETHSGSERYGCGRNIPASAKDMCPKKSAGTPTMSSPCR